MTRFPITCLLAGLLLAGTAQAVPERLSTDAADAVARLQANTAGAILHRQRPESAYSMLRATGTAPLLADGGAGTPVERAQWFLSLYGAAMGITDPALQLRYLRTSRDVGGRPHVHFEQIHDGVPVFAARVVVHLNDQGVSGVNGVFITDLPESGIEAALDLAELRATASRIVSKTLPGTSLEIESARFVVYPLGLLQGRLHESRLALDAIVSNPVRSVRERIFVDAERGFALNRFSEVHTVLNREIYTPEQTNPPTYDEHETVPDLPPPGPADPPLINDPGHDSEDFSTRPNNPPVDNLWIFAGGTYALYENMFGRAGYDACDLDGPCQPDTPAPPWSPDRGEAYEGQVQKSVYLINDACPNAYWNGDSTNYCPGFDADDIVSHEWSHAYTQFTHGLIYQYQSGALNESYSDIFGEAYDLMNGIEGQLGQTLDEHQYYEDVGSRWVLGEDLSEEAAALLLRDMWKPDDFPAANPGKATSGNYSCGASDNGGVHFNSSVPNHAFAMLVDSTRGQGPAGSPDEERNSYNGQSFDGIGIVKASHIYFHAMNNYQTPSTDFPQHANALRASCQDLIGVPLNGPDGAVSGLTIAQGDCDILHQAMLATEMDLGTPCPFIPVLEQGPPPMCESANEIFTENWEDGDEGWTRTSQGEFTDWEDGSRDIRDFKLISELPGNRPGTSIFARNAPIGEPGGGDCQPGSQDYSGLFTIDSPAFDIPEGASDIRLRFDHYVATEADFDGGQLEYSVNGGAFQLVPQGNYEFNAPNAQLDAPPPVGLNTNPRAGQNAWQGADVNAPSGSGPGSWGTTVADLSGLVTGGDIVKLRLTFSQDGCNGVDGWYVDEISLHSCPTLEPPELSVGSDYEDPDTDGSFTLEWVRPDDAVGPDLLQVSELACAPLFSEDAESGFGQWTTSGTSGWKSSQTKAHGGTTSFWGELPKGFGGAVPMTTANAIDIPAEGTTRLSYWDFYFNESDDSVMIEVSTDGGTNWEIIHQAARGGPREAGAEALASEPMAFREHDLTPFAGESILLRFSLVGGGSVYFFEDPYGWYVDDLAIENEHWGDVLTTPDTSVTLSNQADGTRCYRTRTTYDINGAMTASKYSNIISVTVEADSVVNLPPVADAGEDFSVPEGDNATLDGTLSTDPNGTEISFSWTQLSGPTVDLAGADTSTPSFTAPDVNANTELTFQLEVTDPGGLNATDTVVVTVVEPGQPPVANAGPDQEVDERVQVILDGSGSSDPENQTLAYAWTQVSGPSVELLGATTANPTFFAPQVDRRTVLEFELTVTDPSFNEDTDQVRIVVVDTDGESANTKILGGPLLPGTTLLLGVLALVRRRRITHYP